MKWVLAYIVTVLALLVLNGLYQIQLPMYIDVEVITFFSQSTMIMMQMVMGLGVLLFAVSPALIARNMKIALYMGAMFGLFVSLFYLINSGETDRFVWSVIIGFYALGYGLVSMLGYFSGNLMVRRED